MEKTEMQLQDVMKVTGKKIHEEIELIRGEDFEAYYNAEKIIKEKGLIHGPMNMDYPIGLVSSKQTTYIAKWGNIPTTEWNQLDGLMLSENFRHENVRIIIFK